MTEPPAFPITLQQLGQWKAELIDRVVERIRLALAVDNCDRAHLVLDDYQREQRASPPVESVLDERAAAALRRRGVWTVAELKLAAAEFPNWTEIGPTLRRRIETALEQLG